MYGHAHVMGAAAGGALVALPLTGFHATAMVVFGATLVFACGALRQFLPRRRRGRGAAAGHERSRGVAQG